MAIALMVMAAVAQLFGVFGRGVAGSQAAVELSARIRSSGWQLRKDLAGITCDVVPWLAPEADAGYFEYIEGPRNDQSAAHGTTNLEADTDDVILFTTRATGEPFAGTVAGGGTVESQYAEVVWFCKPMPAQPVSGLTLHNLHRRQLLVCAVPGAGAFANAASTLGGSASPFSTRVGSDNRTRPNSLGDLTKREHRFLHGGDAPYRFLGSLAAGATLTGDQEGDDILLTNVIAFDVRAFDAQAGGTGGYIDLASGGTQPLGVNPPLFSGTMMTTGTTATQRAVYDTWSTHYTFPNPGSGWADASQYATAPPYNVALRGIEVRIRCYEPTSRQVRQVTVRHSFVKK